MVIVHSIAYAEICLNRQLLGGNVNKCAIIQEDGRYGIGIRISDQMLLGIDIEKSLVEFKYTRWDSETEICPLIDMTISLASLPSWVAPYTTAPNGCLQWIYVTMKIEESRSNYLAFTAEIVSQLSPLQCAKISQAEALAVWEKRSLPPKGAVNGVDIRLPLFQSFSLSDLNRVKDNNKWLSDTHVTFSLMDSYLENSSKNIWGNVKIKLLDTAFWSQLANNPDGYHKRYRAGVNLLGYDFAVMPMFGNNHWRLGIIENPAELLEGKTVFHILDSLPGQTPGNREARCLQVLILKHFEGAVFKEGLIRTNFARVPKQPNANDCGCFVIYFAKRFFSNPQETMVAIKNSFPSSEDCLAAWGLKNHDVTFVRVELVTLLLKYITQGDGLVKYQQ